MEDLSQIYTLKVAADGKLYAGISEEKICGKNLEEKPVCHGEKMQPIHRFLREGKVYREYRCNCCGDKKTVEVEWVNRDNGGVEK